MRTGGTELLVGVVRDSMWGLMLAVAIGGIFVEVLQDSALAPLPVTSAQVRRMLGTLRGCVLLDGARGGAPADLSALSAVIARIGDLAVALGDDYLESLESDPLWVDARLSRPRCRRHLDPDRGSTVMSQPPVDPRTPVVVGVGQAFNASVLPGYRRLSPVDLAAEAAVGAVADTGADPGGGRGGHRYGGRGSPVRELRSRRASAAGPVG